MPLDQPHEADPSEDPDYGLGSLPGGSKKKKLHFDHTMPLGDHLEELRSRLIKMMVGVVAALVLTIYYGFEIVGWLARPLIHVQNAMGITSPPIDTGPTAGFTNVYCPVVLIAAVIVASPWILWQAWKFIVVGLYEHERKAVHILAPFSTVMTFLGVLFTYYFLLPVSIAFFLNFVNFYPEVDPTEDPPWITQQLLDLYAEKKASLPEDYVFDTKPFKIPVLAQKPEKPEEGDLWINAKHGRVELFFGEKTSIIAQRSTKLITPLPTMSEYIRFASFMMLGIVAAFQLPVIMLVLGWTQLFDPRGIASLRKYAVFISCVLGAILTPSDPLSMIVLAVPLYLLFELGLVLMKLTFKKGDETIPDEL